MKKCFKKIIDALLNIFLFIVLLGLLFQMVLSSFTLHVEVSGISMTPTLYSGEHGRSFTFNLNNIERGDIVVVSKEYEEYIIKRVVAIPGDTIMYTLNTLYINGELIEEPHIKMELLEEGVIFDNIGPLTLGDNEYFIMGDNRAHSLDSRVYGPITRAQIISRGFIPAENDFEFVFHLINGKRNG